jgi:hypothetical protein
MHSSPKNVRGKRKNYLRCDFFIQFLLEIHIILNQNHSSPSPSIFSYIKKKKTEKLQCATPIQEVTCLPKLAPTLAADRFSIRILDFNNMVAVRGWTPL